MVTFQSPFAVQDRVYIDGDERLIGCVTAVLWRNENPLIEVSWVDGHGRTGWFEQWRLKKVED